MASTPGRSSLGLGPARRRWLDAARAQALAGRLTRAEWRQLRPMVLRLAGMQRGDVVLAALRLHLRQRRAMATRPPTPWTIEQAVNALSERKGAVTLWGALRLLQAAQPAAGRIGGDGPQETDPVRLSQGLVLGFTGLEVADVREVTGAARRPDGPAANVLTGAAPRRVAGQNRRVGVVQNAVGLLGPNGPMPLVWTQHVRSMPNTRAVRARDSFLAFLNVLQRRHLSLLYRAWADVRPETAFDVVADQRARHPISDRLRALSGLAHAALDTADSVPHDFKLAFASTLASRVRSPVALQAMLAQFLGVPVRIDEFSARWLDIPADQQSQLGWRFATLGRDGVAGRRTWDCTTRFDIVIGPLPLARYRALLPGSAGWAQLQDLVSLYCGPEWNWRVRLSLDADQVPPCRLGGTGGQLGWSSWLPRPAQRGVADDLAISCSPALRERRTPDTLPAAQPTATPP